MTGKIECYYGDGEPVWCGVIVDGEIRWLCRHHYKRLLSKLEEGVLAAGLASLDNVKMKTRGIRPAPEKAGTGDQR